MAPEEVPACRPHKQAGAGRRARGCPPGGLCQLGAWSEAPLSSGRPGRLAGPARSGHRSRPHGCSPMKICGTVRRPVVVHHVLALRRVQCRCGSLRSGLDPTLLEQHLGAHGSRGRPAVVYILTACMVSWIRWNQKNWGGGRDCLRSPSPPDLVEIRHLGRQVAIRPYRSAGGLRARPSGHPTAAWAFS